MRNPFSYLLQIKSFTFFTALFVCILILQLLYQNTDFELVEMNKLIVSQATADGISIQSRVDLFYGAIVRLLVLMLVNLTIFHFLFHRIHLKSHQKSVILLLSSAGISITLLQVIGVESKSLIQFLLFILSYKIIVYGLGNRPTKRLRIFKAEVLSNSILGFGFLIYFAVLYLTGSTQFLPIYALSVIFLSFVYPLLFQYSKLSFRKINYILFPLIFLSFLSFLAIELVMLQYQNGADLIAYRKLYILLFVLLSAVFYTLNFFKKKSFKSASYIFKKYLGPSVVVAFGLMLYYFPIVAQNTEIFELGNPANAIMNIFKFNEIPFVDFMSSHMFSEQWYGIIYSLIFGYSNNLDFQIYFFFNRLLFLLVVYFVMNKLFKKPAFSLLFVLVFPFLTEIFSNDLIFCLLPFFIIQRISKESSSKLYFYLFGSIVLLIIWKIDTGYAALISSFFYFLLLLISRSISVQKSHLFKGLLITVSIVLGLLLIAILIRDGHYILDNFKSALHYVSGNQAHGYSQIAYNYPHQFYISYFFLPLISVLSILYIVYRLWKKEDLISVSKNDLLILHSSLFFFLISLANAQRGIVRHGYAESNDGAIITTFYIATALLLLFLLRNQLAKSRMTFFYVACFSLFLIFRFFPYQPEYSTFDRAVKKNALISLNVDIAAKTELQRTQADHGFYDAKLKDFKSFIDDNLTENQTFLDFSNTPMLYYYSGKKVPGYFCQNLQNSIDEYTQLSLLKDVNPIDVPVVVFSSHPKTWFDETDGIPNSMRYYLVAEYIYQNYEPYAIMSDKRIWKAKDFKITSEKSNFKYTVPNVPVEYNYKKAAHYILDFFQRKDFEGLEEIKKWEYDKDLKNTLDSVSIENLARNIPNAYLLFEFEENRTPSNKSLQLRDSSGNFLDFINFDMGKDLGTKFMIRISNSYHWHNGNAKYFTLQNISSSAPKSITLYKDSRFED